MSEPIISVSGLRGIVGDTLTPAVATGYAAAFAELLSPGPIVVTRDGRANGPDLVLDVMVGLRQGLMRRANRDVVLFDGGIAATPTTGVLVRDLRCAGGVQVSASHNPAEWNGLKLFSADGRVVPGEFGRRVLIRYRELSAAGSAIADRSIQHSQIATVDDTTSAHLALIERIVDVERIRAQEFHVLLDANHGAGCILGARLLKVLAGCVTIIGDTPDGRFAHQPEPTAENLAGVLDRVTAVGADVGFCQDPDADRLAIIDENGRYIGEEYTLALCVDHVLRRRPGPVVTNCSTSRMTEDLARKYHVPFFRSAVGEANVVDAMLARGAVLGGEGNGGVIDPRVVLVRDSFVAMALVLDAMASRELSVSALADELPRYAIHKTKIEMPTEKVPAALDALERHFHEAAADRLDGLRLDWPGVDARGGRWLLVRGSNTEPILRIVAEAPTPVEAEKLCADAKRVIYRSCSN
jgi:phosphomannomutase